MGRQVLTGISPLAMQRCNVLPENCYITEADVERVLHSETTLDGEMKVHHIHVAFAEKQLVMIILLILGCRRFVKY